MAVHIHPVLIPPRYYKQIGRVIVGWNLTEALISSIVWHIHGVRDVRRGRLFTYRTAANEKLKMFKVSIRVFAAASIKVELKKLHDRAAALKSKRNMVAHGLWGRMPKQTSVWKTFYLRDTDDTILLKREALTVEDVKRMADQIDDLNRDIKKWMTSNRVSPP